MPKVKKTVVKKATKKVIKKILKPKLEDVISDIRGYDWEVIRSALKIKLDDMQRYRDRSNSYDRERVYRDIEELYLIIGKVDRIVNFGRPKIRPERFTL